MKENKKIYESPLCGRYAVGRMSYIWSAQNKHSLWRKLLIELAKAEKQLGIKIKNEQIAEMEQHVEDIDFDTVAKKEAELRHDVMSHIHVFGEQCPKAKPIIHLGATSCFVTDRICQYSRSPIFNQPSQPHLANVSLFICKTSYLISKESRQK